MSEQEGEPLIDLLGEPVKQKKIRKKRSTPRFVLMRVDNRNDGEVFVKVDEGISRQDCEKKAMKQPDGTFDVFCLHSRVEGVSETVKLMKRIKR